MLCLNVPEFSDCRMCSLVKPSICHIQNLTVTPTHQIKELSDFRLKNIVGMVVVIICYMIFMFRNSTLMSILPMVHEGVR